MEEADVKEHAVKMVDSFEGHEDEAVFESFEVTADNPMPFEVYVMPQKVHGIGLCICQAGTATVSIDKKQYRIGKQDMVIFLPGAVVQPISRSDDFVGYGLMLKVDRVLDVDPSVGVQIYLVVRDHPSASLTDQDLQTLFEMCDLIQKKMKCVGNPYRREIVENLILNLFYEIGAIVQRGKKIEPRKTRGRQEELFEKFLYLVATHYRTHRDLGFYAEQMCLTPKYLSSIVKQVSGSSATECIMRSVIRNAKALLETSPLTVQQIADYLNFPTPSFFGQYFKKHVGMTPKEYRMQSH